MRPQSDQHGAASITSAPEYTSVLKDEAALVCLEWLKRHTEQEVLIERWQKLESEVCRLPDWRNLSDHQKLELPQTAAMKQLDKRIDKLFRINERLISGVVGTDATTTLGILCKVRVAASLVPQDENENAHMLLQGILRDAEKLWGAISASSRP